MVIPHYVNVSKTAASDWVRMATQSEYKEYWALLRNQRFDWSPRHIPALDFHSFWHFAFTLDRRVPGTSTRYLFHLHPSIFSLLLLLSTALSLVAPFQICDVFAVCTFSFPINVSVLFSSVPLSLSLSLGHQSKNALLWEPSVYSWSWWSACPLSWLPFSSSPTSDTFLAFPSAAQ